MKTRLLKYRFFVIGVLLKGLCFLTFTDITYFKILFSIPDNLLQMIFTLSIMIADVYFLIDTIAYFINMRGEILLRVSKKRLYLILLRKSFLSSLLLVLVQYCFYVDSLIFVLLFYMINGMLFILLAFVLNKNRETTLLYIDVILAFVIKEIICWCF